MVQKKSTVSKDMGKSSLDEANKTTQTATKGAAGKKSKKKPTRKKPTKQRAKQKVTSKPQTATEIQATTQKIEQSSVNDKKTPSKENKHTQVAAKDIDEAPMVVGPSNSNGQHKSGRGLAWVALLCSLAALAAGGYAAYQTSINTKVTGSQVTGFDDRLKLLVADQQTLKGNFDGLSQKAEGINQEVSTELQKTSVELSSLQTNMSSLQVASDAAIAEVKAGLGQSVARWQLDELHALLSHVNQYYQFTGDNSKAIQGLELAQAKLKTINNPHIAPVSTALAEDILGLESTQSVDVQALYNSLGGIASLIPELKFADGNQENIAADPDAPVSASSKDKSVSGGGLLSVGKALLGDLGNLVQHKNLDAPLKPTLDDSARFIFYESMQLKIQAATAALLRRDNAAYQVQLQQASQTLQTNFDAEDVSTKTISTELEAAQKQNVSLTTSAISKALTALDKVMVLEN